MSNLVKSRFTTLSRCLTKLLSYITFGLWDKSWNRWLPDKSKYLHRNPITSKSLSKDLCFNYWKFFTQSHIRITQMSRLKSTYLKTSSLTTLLKFILCSFPKPLLTQTKWKTIFLSSKIGLKRCCIRQYHKNQNSSCPKFFLSQMTTWFF